MSPLSASRLRNGASAASGNTAIATTGTGRAEGDFQPIYVGRFAPSPTGALHLGSLVAAVGSYLDARAAGGRWLVRMEDLDTTRVVPGCADIMLRTLEGFGLHWDGEVEFQSRRTALYAEALNTLRAAGRTFECSCSRRELASQGETGYPGTCRSKTVQCSPTATRFRIDDDTVVSFVDRVQGECRFPLRELGDPVIRRRDGVFAYQLAVVVDDAAQSVSDVVRGADLLQSTAWQIHFQQAFNFPSPRYAHLPVVVESAAGKLAKSRRSLAIDPAHAGSQLHQALSLLQHKPPSELTGAPAAELLAWAEAAWDPGAVRGLGEITVSSQMPQV
ncbi:MAG TPA: tRNA glutamyl-Q(34) synthetase GluQRS [Steroidobacteraceae bacterium]|nr:tRNA glutamyl-Q(34) synthetase GluQRS [Steroidobacteraceae bacterium]